MVSQSAFGRIAGRTSLGVVAVAVAAVALGACTPLPGAPGGVGSNPVTTVVKAPGTLHHVPTIGDFAPTPDLAIVANAVQFRAKSVSSEITLNPGLKVTHPIDVTVSYPVADATRPYSATFGNAWKFQFPENGGNPYTRQVTVTFVEHVTSTRTETFSRSWYPTIEPLYNFTVSPLIFTLKDDCDTFGDSEVKILVRDAKGNPGNYHVDTSAGRSTTFSSFAQRYTEVGASTNLHEPGAAWLEHDADLGVGDAPPPANGFNLATHPNTFTYDAVSSDGNGQSCRGRLVYSVIKSPVITYGLTA